MKLNAPGKLLSGADPLLVILRPPLERLVFLKPAVCHTNMIGCDV